MTSMHTRRPAMAVAATSCLFVIMMIAAGSAQQPQGRGQQAPAAPTGPMAPEKYKNIQAMTDVQADQVDVTMRYISAATGFQCINCHVQDAATGEWQYEKDDKNPKKTARQMINLVKTVNAGDFGGRINCGTCHAGNNRPPGQQPAQMMTADQITAFQAQQAAIAARQGGAAAGGAPGGAAGAPGGRGQQQQGPPPPPVDDVVNKYIEGLGGRAAIEKLTAVMMSGTVTNRAAQASPFTIEEKGNKYRESVQSATPVTRAFDGAAGWVQSGTKIETLDAFPTQQVLRREHAMLALRLKEKFPNLTAQRLNRLTTASGATPIDVNVLTSGTPAVNYTTETMYFDAATGLLLRKVVRTTTGLRGTLTEQWDYSDYRAVAGVKMPFEIKHTNWNTVDTFKVADIKANPSIDDARFVKPKV